MRAGAEGKGGGGQASTCEIDLGHGTESTKWKKVVGLRVRGGGEGPDPVEHCNQAHSQRAFFLDTRFIRTPEKTPTTPLIERGAKTPGKKRED